MKFRTAARKDSLQLPPNFGEVCIFSSNNDLPIRPGELQRSCGLFIEQHLENATMEYGFLHATEAGSAILVRHTVALSLRPVAFLRELIVSQIALENEVA